MNLYDAAGRKYKSVIYTNTATAGTQYDEIAHYEFDMDTVVWRVTEYNNNMELVYTREDTITRRIHNSIGYNADGIYYHYIKDHLGNICAVVNSETNTPVQRTTYYASGVPMAENLGPDVPPSLYYAMGVQYTENFGRDEQPYLYNGKEFIESHGLNEYDSQARMYYAPIMRTTTIDPMAENYYHISPYAWCGNNPANVVDVHGMDTVKITYNQEIGSWNYADPIIAEGNDVFRITNSEGITNTFTFSNGEYGKRVCALNIYDDGEESYCFGIMYVSSKGEEGVYFYVTPGGNSSAVENSGCRIPEDNYSMYGGLGDRWKLASIGVGENNDVTSRNIRIHYAGYDHKSWETFRKNTLGCFVVTTYNPIQNNTFNWIGSYSKSASRRIQQQLGGTEYIYQYGKGFRYGALFQNNHISFNFILKSNL